MSTKTRREFLERGLAVAVWARAAEPRAERSAAPSRPPRVIVLGAGLAGLAAAYELCEAGCEVLVLEARSRPGGRVETVRGRLADGLYAETGAVSVFDSHADTLDYARRLDVALDPLELTGATLYHLRGRRLVERPGLALDWPVALSAEERALGRAGLWERYVGAFLAGLDPAALEYPLAEPLLAHDAHSFASWLHGRGVSAELLALLRLGVVDLGGGGVERTSALHVLRDLAQRARRRRVFTIRGGSERLPLAFAQRLGERVRYGAPVVALEQRPDAVGVTWLRAGERVTSWAERVVCTLPFPLLGRIDVRPTFSAGKRRAIAELRYSSVVRVFVQCRRRFWLDEGLSGTGFTDLPIMSVFDRSGTQPGPRGLLETYTTGESARRLAALDENERQAAVLGPLRRLLPGIHEAAEGGFSKSWADDEWSRGAYAWFAPGQLAALGPHLASVEGRVHFAGEHTSAWPGWMQGALASGRRAAREVLAVLHPTTRVAPVS